MGKENKFNKISNMAELATSLKKDYGDEYVTNVDDIGDVERLSTGIYDLDFATGGGFPRGDLSILWGPESCAKTNIALKAIANSQKDYPNKACMFVDLERGFNAKWATKIGVDCSKEKLYVIQPHYAEQAVNIIQAALMANNLDVMVIDSIGAMVTANEDESDAGKMQVGGSALLISKLMKKVIVGLGKANEARNYPTIIVINQMRNKIGVMFGSPDNMAGGFALKHKSALTLKLRGTDVTDAKINPDRPCAKEVFGTIVKAKVPILKSKFDFEFPVVNQKGLRIGHCDDWRLIEARLKDLGWMTKTAKNISFLGETYPTFKAIREYIYKTEPGIIVELRKKIIEAYEDELFTIDDEK